MPEWGGTTDNKTGKKTKSLGRKREEQPGFFFFSLEKNDWVDWFLHCCTHFISHLSVQPMYTKTNLNKQRI